MRYRAIWLGIDPKSGVNDTQVDGRHYKRGEVTDIEESVAKRLIKLQGFVIFSDPSNIFELVLNSLSRRRKTQHGRLK